MLVLMMVRVWYECTSLLQSVACGGTVGGPQEIIENELMKLFFSVKRPFERLYYCDPVFAFQSVGNVYISVQVFLNSEKPDAFAWLFVLVLLLFITSQFLDIITFRVLSEGFNHSCLPSVPLHHVLCLIP